MKDAEYAEQIKFQIFPIFIFRVMVIFVLKSLQFSMNFLDNSKNENWKIYFSFDQHIKTEGKGGPGRSAYP